MLKKLLEYLQYFLNLWKKQPETSKPAIVHIPRKPRVHLEIDTTRKWEGIVWHHSASKDHVDINDWEGIKRYHTSWRIDGHIVTEPEWDRRFALKEGNRFEKPYRAVGYQGGIEVVSADKIVFHWGRPLSMDGAHSGVKNVSTMFNKTHIGLCAIGNYDKRQPHKDVWDFCLSVTRTFMDAFDIPPEKIIGHREVYKALNVPVQKTCPGRFWNMLKFRDEL